MADHHVLRIIHSIANMLLKAAQTASEPGRLVSSLIPQTRHTSIYVKCASMDTQNLVMYNVKD